MLDLLCKIATGTRGSLPAAMYVTISAATRSNAYPYLKVYMFDFNNSTLILNPMSAKAKLRLGEDNEEDVNEVRRP
jgi:hypothetical protein